MTGYIFSKLNLENIWSYGVILNEDSSSLSNFYRGFVSEAPLADSFQNCTVAATTTIIRSFVNACAGSREGRGNSPLRAAFGDAVPHD